MSQGQNLLARTKGELMRSFWFKLFLGMTALLIVAVLVTAGVFVLNRSASETVIQQALDRDMRENGYLIAKFVRAYGIPSYYEKGELAKLQTVLQTVRNDKDPENILYIFVKDADGNIVAQAPEDITGSQTSAGVLSGINTIPQSNAVSHQYITSSLTLGMQYQILDTAISVLPNQRAELHVGLRAGRLDVGSDSSWIVWIVIPVLLVVLIIAGSLGGHWLIAAQIRRPIEKFVGYVSQIGQGNLDHLLDLEVTNELSVLKESLTDMVDQLKGTVQTESDINRMQGQIMNMLSTVSAAADGNLTVEAEVTADALGSLADAFNMPHETVRISHYDGEIYRDKPIVDDTFRLHEGEKYLIVDDLVDGGSTMLTFKEHFGIREQDAVAVLFWYPKGKFKPDYYVRKKPEEWLVFPWEVK